MKLRDLAEVDSDSEVTGFALDHRKVARGSVFIPFHFREAAANVLTIDELDPYGKIPEFKFCAVRIDSTV